MCGLEAGVHSGHPLHYVWRELMKFMQMAASGECAPFYGLEPNAHLLAVNNRNLSTDAGRND